MKSIKKFWLKIQMVYWYDRIRYLIDEYKLGNINSEDYAINSAYYANRIEYLRKKLE